MVVLGVDDACESKVADLEQEMIAVDEEIRGLEIAVKNIGRVDVLESSQELIEEQLYVFLSEPFMLHQLVEVRVHQFLNDVHALCIAQHRVLLVERPSLRAQYLVNQNHVVVSETFQDPDLAKRLSTASLVGDADLLDGNTIVGSRVRGRKHEAAGAVSDGLQVREAIADVEGVCLHRVDGQL